MQSYKDASERMTRMGNLLEGFHYTSFQENIVRDICRHYFILQPILKDRPNVTLWFTNKDDEDTNISKTTESNKSTVFLSSDDKSTESITEFIPHSNKEDIDITIGNHVVGM